MILVSKNLEHIVKSSIQYVEELKVMRKSSIISLFSGIKRLTIWRNWCLIQDSGLSLFNKNSLWLRSIWTNLEYLNNPYNTLEFWASQFNPEDPFSQQLFRMSNLSILKIFLDSDVESVGHLNIDPRMFPRLKRLELDNVVLPNVGLFKTLDFLSITRSTQLFTHSTLLKSNMLNNLNIARLNLCSVMLGENFMLNIPYLRSLEIGSMVLDLNWLFMLIISELKLVNVIFHTSYRLDISSLRKLEIVDVCLGLD